MSQVILIAGASKGIGLVMARHLQAQGHTVFGTSRQPEKSNIDDLRLLALDVNNPQSIQQCIETVMHASGRIDVLINNAGYDLYGAAEDTSDSELRAQIETNFFGAVNLTQAVLPIMRKQGSGKIIHLSSIGGLVSLPFNSAYAASKFALEGYMESLRYELLPFNIFVSLVEPGQVRTETLETSVISTQKSTIFDGQQVAQRAREQGKTASLKPEQIAQTISRIIAAKQPRLRYPVGSQVRMVVMLQRILPERLFESFIMSQFVKPLLKNSVNMMDMETTKI